MWRSFKKASLLIGVLACTLMLQGCIAQIMSAAGGILAGLGQAFGGETGQILGQIGKVLGGVGQAFGQQQAGIAGQLAGAAGGVTAGVTGGVQLPGVQVGATGVAQIPTQQPGSLLGVTQLPTGGGTIALPQPPGAAQVQQVLGILQQSGITNPNPQQIATASAQIGITDPNAIASISAQLTLQLGPVNNQLPQFPPTQIPGYPIPGITGPVNVGQIAPPQIQIPSPQQIPGVQIPGIQISGGGNLFAGAFQATTGAINLVNVIQQASGGGGGASISIPQPPLPSIQPPSFDVSFDFSFGSI